MKKYLLITFAGLLFATVNTFAHCGSCGVDGKEAHEHAMKCASACTMACSKGEAKCACGEKCTKAANAEMSKKCTEGCAKPCCAKKAEKCTEGCTKPCCAKPKASDEAEPTASAAPSCCPAKTTAPA